MGRAREISDAPVTFCAQARDSVNDEVATTLLRIRPLPPGPLRAPIAARGTGHAAHAQGLRYASALRREQQFAADQRRNDRAALARQLRGREQSGPERFDAAACAWRTTKPQAAHRDRAEARLPVH